MPDGYQHSQGRSRILSANFPAAAAVDTDVILAAVTDTGVEVVIEAADLDSQPDVPRNITATSGGTATDIGAVQVIVTGKNVWGQSITETLPVFTANSATTVVGSKAFYSIDDVTIPAHDGLAATTSIGVGEKLGLPTTLSRDTVVAAYHNGVKEANAYTLAFDSDEVEKNTIVIDTNVDGSDVIVDYYK